MVLFPNCKINLGLRILSKREDGYHELESVLYPVPFYDVLEITPSESFKFIQTGLQINGSPEENICVKAFRLLEDRFQIEPVSIHLHKQLPMGAGMGGGSANGTFVLAAINKVLNIGITEQEMIELSAQLGSDCPFFVRNIPQLAKGRGDVLAPIDVNLKGKYLGVEHLPIHISTADAFSGVHISGVNEDWVDIFAQPIEKWRDLLYNDFENHIFEKYPALGELKDHFYQSGALYASLTGSGSVVYGIFDEIPVGFKKVIEL